MNIFKNKSKIKIIPLGQSCMPRTILTRWKLKPSKLQGELTYPFDLAVFGMPEITKTLKTNFNEFFDNLQYKDNCWIKAPNCIIFCDDTDFKENDKQKLIKRYTNRIQNFRNALVDEDFILFIQILGDCEEVEKQFLELKKIRCGKPFKLAVIDTQNIVKDININDIYVLKQPYPMPDYKNNWWKKSYYNSREGKIFEKNIVDFCSDIIKTF